MRTAMRKMAGVMYELDRRLVVARLRRGRRLKAERGGFAGGGVRYGFTTERSSSSPTRPSGTSSTASAGCTGAAYPSARSPTSSTPSRSHPNAAGHGTRPPSPESSGGHREQLLADRASAGADALVAYQGGLTRTTRLQRLINTNIDLLGTNIDLLGRLPADHTNRATLEDHNGELICLLVRRQRRRFEPFTRAGISFGANATAAVVALGATAGMALQAGGMASGLDRDDPRRAAGRMAFYASISGVFAGFAFRAWLRQRREHPAQPERGPGPSSAQPQPSEAG